jgi:hypothetical protein
MAPASEFADILDQTHDTADSSMEEMRAIAERMRVESGLPELELAVTKKLIRFNDVTLSDDMDAALNAFIEELKRYLLDPKWFVLVDEQVASLARSMIKEGVIKPPERAISNAGEALLGNGFLARLPAFHGAPDGRASRSSS